MPRLIAKGALFASMWISAGLPVPASEPEIVSVRKIWDRGEHNAFTDLIRFQDRWWCTFREAKDHGPSLGQVRVIVSTDGEKWESAALLEEREVDLRDPKLPIMPDGRLMLIMGAASIGARPSVLARPESPSPPTDANGSATTRRMKAKRASTWQPFVSKTKDSHEGR